jgi:predicted metal-dependent hydrolase
MAPEPIINYLVIHELCHILQHNHSPAFWKKVEKYCPNYKEQGTWLKLNGAKLEI